MTTTRHILPLLFVLAAAAVGCGDEDHTNPVGPDPHPRDPEPQPAYPQVWSQNAYDGQSFEFKTNCSPDHVELETCFLWDVTAVIVEAPDGERFELDKDFNINSYSGEVTRRWVLYGPVGAGLAAAGDYRFHYYKGEEIALTQVVPYTPEVVGFPTDVVWSREGDDLIVTWTPPAEAAPGMQYKVLLFPHDRPVISLIFDWDARDARLPDIPLADGEPVTLNVAIYFDGGFSPSRYYSFTW